MLERGEVIHVRAEYLDNIIENSCCFGSVLKTLSEESSS